MRIFIALALGGLLTVGCGDDGGGSGATGGTGGTGAVGGSGGSTGLSVLVSWEALLPCEMMMPSDYEVTVAVEGEIAPITVEGSVTFCTGPIDMLGTNSVGCPNNAPYSGMVTVTDAVGSEEVPFTISPCMNGSAP